MPKLSEQTSHTLEANPLQEFTLSWSGFTDDLEPGEDPPSDKEKRRTIAGKMAGMTFGINPTAFRPADLNALIPDVAVFETHNKVATSGIAQAIVYYDGTSKTGEVKAGQPVVFDTVTGYAVTGINEDWGEDEYVIVGTALVDYSTVKDIDDVRNGEDRLVPILIRLADRRTQPEYKRVCLALDLIPSAKKLRDDDISATWIIDSTKYNPDQFNEGDVVIGEGEVEIWIRDSVQNDPLDDDSLKPVLKLMEDDLGDPVTKSVYNLRGHVVPGYYAEFEKDNNGTYWVIGPEWYHGEADDDFVFGDTEPGTVTVNGHTVDNVYHDIFSGDVSSGKTVRIDWNDERLCWQITGAEC